MHSLTTIRFSHYNEKARWALDRFAVPYREHGYMPMLHFLPVAWATRGRSDAAPDELSTRLSTPVFRTANGDCICDSTRIVQWVDEHHATPETTLYPDPACGEIARRCAEQLGGHTRRLAYFWVLQSPEKVRALARANVGRLQSWIFAVARPVGSAVLKRALQVDADHAARSRKRVLEEVAWASDRLGGRDFLVGERFSAADLALACMLAPSLLVSHEEGFSARLPTLEDAHPDAVAFARQVRDTPAGRHALRMFRDERARIVASGNVATGAQVA